MLQYLQYECVISQSWIKTFQISTFSTKCTVIDTLIYSHHTLNTLLLSSLKYQFSYICYDSNIVVKGFKGPILWINGKPQKYNKQQFGWPLRMDTMSEKQRSTVLFVHLLLRHETRSISCRLLASPTNCSLTLPYEWYVTQNGSWALIVSVCSESRLLYCIWVLWRSGWWWCWWWWLPPCQGC